MSFDEWTPGPPPVPTPPIGGLPAANSWNPAQGCSSPPTAPSIAAGVIITGRPALISAMPWQITINDGGGPPNFTIDHYDASGTLIDHPLEFSGVDGSATFADPVHMPAATAASLQITNGPLVIPDLLQLIIPGGTLGTYIGPVSGSGTLAWFNLPIANDAPQNGNFYGRVNGAWSSGGIFVSPVYFPANNSVSIVGPAATQRAILGGTGVAPSAISWRWQMLLGDQTAETGGNAGSNFVLNAIGDGGGLMNPSALTINRSTLAAVLGGTLTVPGPGGNSPAVMISKPLGGTAAIAGQNSAGAMRWQAYLGDYTAELGGNFGTNFRLNRYDDSGTLLDSPLVINRSSGVATFSAMPSFPGGVLNYVLATNGAGLLAWAPPGLSDAPFDGRFYGRTNGAWVEGGAGAIAEAPEDGTTYARNDAAWVHLTHNDITDWAAELANYYPTSNPSGYQTAAQVTAALAPYALSSTLQGYLPLTAGPSAPLSGPLVSSSYVMLATAGANRAVVGATAANIPRWAIYPGDATAEGGANAGSNFLLQSYTDTGAALATPLSITRAGLATFSQLPSFPGGVPSQVLSTNGAGVLSWAAQPAVPPASTVVPQPDGAGAVGTSTAYARADHVHPNIAMNDNRIINGDMRIDQRGGTGRNATVANFVCDRWYYGASQSVATWSQTNSIAMAANGFPNVIMLTANSSYTPLANEAFAFYQTIEADMISDFAWGTAGAQPVTLSFWAMASKTGTYSGTLTNYGGTRSYPFTFNIAASTVWQKFIITIPGDTTGTWVMSGNGGSLYVVFDLGCGANNRGPPGAWANGNWNGATGSQSVVTTSGAIFQMTGVKLEIGSIATPFNRYSLAKCMADCQRYYERSGEMGQAIVNGGLNGTSFTYLNGNGAYGGGGTTVYFKVSKRGQPTISGYSSVTGAVNMCRDQNANVDVPFTMLTAGSNGFSWYAAPSVNTGINFVLNWVASAEL